MTDGIEFSVVASDLCRPTLFKKSRYLPTSRSFLNLEVENRKNIGIGGHKYWHYLPYMWGDFMCRPVIHDPDNILKDMSPSFKIKLIGYTRINVNIVESVRSNFKLTCSDPTALLLLRLSIE